MKACDRPDCPDWLGNHWEKWGEEYAQRMETNPQYSFNWKTYEGERVNKKLLPLLKEMTQGHCAYCDWFPMDVGTDSTIDHFRPKAQFPEDVYLWSNLYLCCRTCQEKDGQSFNDALLRPDEVDYEFDRFFIYNFRNGELQPNPQASTTDLQRAQRTIDVLKLNMGGRPAARMRATRQFRNTIPSERLLDEWPFRFILVHEMAS